MSLFLSYRHIVWLISNCFTKLLVLLYSFACTNIWAKFLLPSFLKKLFTINLIVILCINTRLYLAFLSPLVWHRFDITLNTKWKTCKILMILEHQIWFCTNLISFVSVETTMCQPFHLCMFLTYIFIHKHTMKILS